MIKEVRGESEAWSNHYNIQTTPEQPVESCMGDHRTGRWDDLVK